MVSSLMFSLVLSLGTFWLIRHRWTETLFIAFPIYPTGSYQIYVVFSTFYVDFSIVLSIVLAIVPVYTALWWICNRHRGWKCFKWDLISILVRSLVENIKTLSWRSCKWGLDGGASDDFESHLAKMPFANPVILQASPVLTYMCGCQNSLFMKRTSTKFAKVPSRVTVL